MTTSYQRNALAESRSIDHARRILSTIYGEETHYFDRRGSDLDYNNCIDIFWKGFRVAVRDNNNGATYWNDIRIRSGTINGEQRSEVDKLLTASPLPDIYVFTYTEQKTFRLMGWNLVNVRDLVAVLSDPTAEYQLRQPRCSCYGETPFRIYNLLKYPQIVCASSFVKIKCSAQIPSLLA